MPADGNDTAPVKPFLGAFIYAFIIMFNIVQPQDSGQMATAFLYVGKLISVCFVTGTFLLAGEYALSF